MQTRHSPIIVGERYELAETLSLGHGGEHPGGLLATPDYETALLSMSGYEKFGASSVKGKSLSVLSNDREDHSLLS